LMIVRGGWCCCLPMGLPVVLARMPAPCMVLTG
jgi:hypothetical protein